MKKINSLLAVLVAVLMASCSNDDIPMDKAVTFKINPSTVVNNLYEYTPGALSSLDSDESLHVSLYVYNEAGVLVAKESQDFSDYTHVMNSVQNLGYGDFTVVATTHVTSSVDYWTFSGQQNLSTFSVKDNGYIGGSGKILGLTTQHVTITENTSDININVEIAGAVALARCMNWNRYSDVEYFGILANKSCDELTLDNQGESHFSVDTKSDYAYYMIRWEYDSNYNGAYGYVFMFPMDNVKMSFMAEVTSGELLTIGNYCIDDIMLGHSYVFAYDVTDNANYWEDMTYGGRSSKDVLEPSFENDKLFSNFGETKSRFTF